MPAIDAPDDQRRVIGVFNGPGELYGVLDVLDPRLLQDLRPASQARPRDPSLVEAETVRRLARAELDLAPSQVTRHVAHHPGADDAHAAWCLGPDLEQVILGI